LGFYHQRPTYLLQELESTRFSIFFSLFSFFIILFVFLFVIHIFSRELHHLIAVHFQHLTPIDIFDLKLCSVKPFPEKNFCFEVISHTNKTLALAASDATVNIYTYTYTYTYIHAHTNKATLHIYIWFCHVVTNFLFMF